MRRTAVIRSIFYSVWTIAFVALLLWLKPENAQVFVDSSFLWKDAIWAGSLCGLLLSVLGVYILLNRIVFVSLALSQGASLGIFLCFLTLDLIGLHSAEATLPQISGLALALFTAYLFARFRKQKNYPDESLMGLIYVAASGLIILIGDRIAEGRHSIDTLLFGDAVAVTPQDLQWVLYIVLPLLLIHFLFRREFIYVSADAEFMKIRGLSSKFWMVFFYFTLALAITLSLKVLGSLPVFALMVIPPFIALKKAKSMQDAFVISALLGILLPALGYFFSFLYSFPTGASVIAVALVYVLGSWGEKYLFTEQTSPKPSPL